MGMGLIIYRVWFFQVLEFSVCWFVEFPVIKSETDRVLSSKLQWGGFFLWGMFHPKGELYTKSRAWEIKFMLHSPLTDNECIKSKNPSTPPHPTPRLRVWRNIAK